MATRRDDIAHRWTEFMHTVWSTCSKCFDPHNEDEQKEENLVYINFLPERDMRRTRLDYLFFCTTCHTWNPWVINGGERTLGEQNYI